MTVRRSKRPKRPVVQQRTVDLYDWLRDVILFAGGLFGVIHETVTGDPHAELLSVFVVMMGLPGLSMLRNGYHKAGEEAA